MCYMGQMAGRLGMRIVMMMTRVLLQVQEKWSRMEKTQKAEGNYSCTSIVSRYINLKKKNQHCIILHWN